MTRERVQVTEVPVRGQTFPVYANPDGRWSADYAGEELWAPSLEALRDRLVTATRRAAIKLEVRFVTADSGRRGSASGAGQRGTLYAIHGGTGNFMVRWEDGTKEQLSYTPTVLPDLTGEELANYRGLIEAERLASRRRSAFEKEREVKLDELARDQLVTEAKRVNA